MGRGSGQAKVGVIQAYPGIGDLIWHLPAIRAIAAHSGGPVALLANARSQADALLGDDPEIAPVVLFRRRRGALRLTFDEFALARQLRALRLERIWILHAGARLARAARRAGIPDRRGLGLGEQEAYLTDPRTLPPDLAYAQRGGQVPMLRRFLGLHGIELGEAPPSLDIPAAEVAAMRERFAERPRPWIGLGIASADGRRAWPPEHFAELAQNLVAGRGRTVFLLGGPGDAKLAQGILEAAGWPGLAIVPTPPLGLGLRQSAALMAACDLFVGNDSGPLNIAAALGVPSYGLFGYGPAHESISPRIRPIYPEDGWTAMADGMRRLSPRHVFAAIAPVLDRIAA
ncbi:MAG TPA: glycosyltransferase family 9 protein [Alphaproteobacteria bacterium]|nr:glycosyltransferase family 9 protein [Alphaproteobacteria bacterium]